MKKGLLGSTALVAATALTATTLSAGIAQAAEAPTWKLSGNMNFQLYVPSGDITGFTTTGPPFSSIGDPTTGPTPTAPQDASVYFGVDEAELQLNVSGTSDSGLDYGFKIELEANTTDGFAADEARISLGGSWGTVLLGDEDGAEDAMNYGGENLLGASGGWDGDGDDVFGAFADYFFPNIAGDTSDRTKATYYSPRFSGIQLGASWTPSDNNGDELKVDGGWENHFGLGVNYDQTFGNTRVQLSGVYSMASSNNTANEDIAAYSLGGIVGFGGFSVAANWTDNGDSGTTITPGISFDDSYWNVGVGWETGPLYLAGGYFARTVTETAQPDGEATAWALTADYTVAPGLVTYAEYTAYNADDGSPTDVSASVFIAGVNVSF